MWLGLNAIMEHAQVVSKDSSTCSVEQILLDMNHGIDRRSKLQTVEIAGKCPWGRSFEEIRTRLQADAPAFVEGDGSFVLCGKQPCTEENRTTLWCGQLPTIIEVQPTRQWRAPVSENPNPIGVWRIEGSLCDGANGLDSISLNGWAPWAEWLRVFELLGPISSEPSPFLTRSVLQFHQFGVYVPITNGFVRES